MILNMKNKNPWLRLNIIASLLFLVLQLSVINLFAQDKKEAILKLSFSQTDSTKTCIATLLSDSLPVIETDVHLYVKTLYALLPVSKVTATDENGEASFEFPTDLPSAKNGMLDIVAKVEKNEIYGNVETHESIKWGITPKSEIDWANRSLSASRERAPMVLVVASTIIILFIWGILFYIIFQLVKIKKQARVINTVSTS